MKLQQLGQSWEEKNLFKNYGLKKVWLYDEEDSDCKRIVWHWKTKNLMKLINKIVGK